MTRIIRIGMWQ
ncbi:hypothetical protein LINPERHAP1_LOCUS15824 [Linum perenne]